jgi:hypothetical protein
MWAAHQLEGVKSGFDAALGASEINLEADPE